MNIDLKIIVRDLIDRPNKLFGTHVINSIEVIDQDTQKPILIDPAKAQEGDLTDFDGEDHYTWYLNPSATVNLTVKGTLKIGELIIPEKPIDFDEITLPHGKYLCKVLDGRDYDIMTGILNVHNRNGKHAVMSFDGSFTFECPYKKILSYCKIE